MYRTGTGLFCPTTTTSPFEQAIAALGILARACEEEKTADASFVGLHIEGPYIASADGPRGAHPSAYIRDPDWDEFCRYQEAAGGRIRMLTLAPEREGALAFIEKATESGVIVALGAYGGQPGAGAGGDCGRCPDVHTSGERGARDAPPARQLYLGTARRRRPLGGDYPRWTPSASAGAEEFFTVQSRRGGSAW